MTTDLSFTNNSIQVFRYEAFNYTISNPNPSLYTLQTVSNTSGLTPTLFFFTKNGNDSYRFSASSNNLTPTTATTLESFTLRVVDACGNALTSSNSVAIGAGRFTDPSGNSLSNNSYTFYKNESITPIRLVAPPSLTLDPPTSGPALPPGLSFVSNASNIYSISGIPTVTVPNSNYLITGTQQSLGKIVTTRFNMVVSNERLRLDLSGASIVNNMRIGEQIEPRIITAIPSFGSSAVRYTFPAFPDGIVVTDLSGTVRSSPFTVTSNVDPSYTFILSGTPTEQAAYAFSRIVSGTPTYTVQAAKTVPLPIVENSQAFSFGFAPTILFDQSTVPQLYTNIAFDPSSIFFRAKTYFSTDVSITNIFSPDLRSDLSLVFVSNESRAYLKGNPIQSSAGSATYTIRAIDASANTRDYPALITVVDDSVSFSSPVGDVCVNYILSRPTSNFLPGYYSSNIRFTATANSRLPVTLSAPALSNLGLSLSNGLLTGTPSAVIPLTDVVVTATVSGSPATATKTIKLAILDDSFNFTDVSAANLNFIQNVPITPFRFPVSTLSERSIINYTQIGFPDGLSINPAGVVSGIPTSSSPTAGNVTISATTGYATGTRDFSYNIVPDSMLFVVPQTSYVYQAGDPVGSIDINGVTFSGTTVSNYDLSISPTYGLTVNSSNGIVSGTWTTGIPPATLLPFSCNFAVNAQAGQLIGTLPMTFTANPVVKNASVFVAYGTPPSSSSFKSWMYYNTTTDVSSFVHVVDASASQPFMDIQFKNNDPTNNTIVATTVGSPGFLFKGTRLNDLSAIPIGTSEFLAQMSSIAFGSGQTLYAAGTVADPSGGGIYRTVLARSSNLGDSFDFSNATVITGVQSRDFNRTYSNTSTALFDPYIKAGVALAYDTTTGVMLAGGSSNSTASNVMVRSLDNGSNWTVCTNGFTKECAYLNIDNPTVWIATGSTEYRTTVYVAQTTGSNPPPPAYSTPATTIKYSTDQGASWYDASGGFNMFGYEIVYANGTWLATGTSALLDTPIIYVPELRYSTNGVNWLPVDFPETVFDQDLNVGLSNNLVSNAAAPLRIGSMNFDGTFWNVFVNEQLPENGRVRLYRHDAVSDLDSGWFAVDISGSLTDGEPEVNTTTRFLSMRNPKYLYTGQPPTTIQLSINTNIGNGPTFTSPTTTDILLYQYMTMTPIQISATGTGQVYLFVETADLPPGLSYSRVTNQITGAPSRIGNDTVTFYAKDDNGTSQIVLNFTTVVPRVIRKQDGAGAYTSLLRQYTEVLGAQNARDNRALPNQERALGEFMSPEAPDVITQTVDPKCFDPKCLR